MKKLYIDNDCVPIFRELKGGIVLLASELASRTDMSPWQVRRRLKKLRKQRIVDWESRYFYFSTTPTRGYFLTKKYKDYVLKEE